MNKTKNGFRKCPFCPHHNQSAKCCCHKSIKSIQNTKKSRSKQRPFINESSIHYPDESQIKFQQINFSNLLAQNSILKCQNSNLKNDLLSLSHCIQDQRILYNKQYISVPTSHTLKTQQQHTLSDRLYISNKNLQEAVLRIDQLSRKNKQLCDINFFKNSEAQALRLENEQLKQDIFLLKKQLKKIQSNENQSEINQIKENFKILRQKYQNLKLQNSNLNENIQKLKYKLSKKNIIVSQDMSPEWIAQTSNKLTFIQQKIDCAQNRLKNPYFEKSEQNQPNLTAYESVESISYFDIIHQIKKQISLSINTIHSKTRKFNSLFDTIGNVDNINVKKLICTLIQGFVESCINLNANIEKELNRKISVLQKRLENLLGKLQNFVLQIKNRQLRKRSTSRSRILINNKSGLNSKSHCAVKSNKQNLNHLNNMDKSY